MLVHHDPTKILIVGKSGVGKTTYLIRYVENAPQTRVFIFDHKREFEFRCGIVPATSIDECAEKVKRGEKYISYFYATDYPGDSESAFQFYCEWVYDVCRAIIESGGTERSLFVGDEVNRFTGTSDIGWEFGQLIEDGRLWGIDFIGTSHGANQIHNKLRLQLSEVVAMRTKDKRPLEFLEECGFDPEEVRALPKGAYIVMDDSDDSFTRGKLFSCPISPDEVNPEKPEDIPEAPETSSPPEKPHAIPGSQTVP
jgi:hypothetical protein